MKIKNLFKLFVFAFFMGLISFSPLFNKVNGETVTENLEETGYLTFSSNNIFSMSRAESPASLDYSIDGSTWQSFPTSNSTATNIITSGLKDGKFVIYLRNSEGVVNTAISGHNYDEGYDNQSGFKFESGSNVDCSGNILTLLDYKKVLNGEEPTLGDFAFTYLFSKCEALISSPTLPSSVISDHAYYYMFSGCKNLKIAPELPATSFASSSSFNYAYMFEGCSNLENAPALPITTLTDNCYNHMFSECSKIEFAPALPATKLAQECYDSMFYSCKNLKTAPELPATTLAIGCYRSMFSRCSSLTEAPELPATTLANQCYFYMFDSCYELVTAPDLPALKLTRFCYYYMFYNCTALVRLPKIAATDFSATDCCYRMFSDCKNIKISTEKVGKYQIEWSLSENTINSENVSLENMFYNTGGTYKGACKAGVKYYLDAPCITHTYGDWIEEKPSTCASLGVKGHYECIYCEYTVDSSYNECTDLSIPKSDVHSLGDLVPETPSNCINAGVKAHYECLVCKGYFDIDKNPITNIILPINPNKHSLGELNKGTPPTCSEKGTVDHYKCLYCDDLFDKDKWPITEEDLFIPRTGHVYTDDEDPTCNVCGFYKLIINYSNYVVDGSIYDINVSLPEGLTYIYLPENTTYGDNYGINEFFDPSGYGLVSSPDELKINPYFLPNKKYYLHIFFEVSESTDIDMLEETKIFVGGKGGVVIYQQFIDNLFNVIVSLPVLGGESKIKDVPKLSYSFEGIEVGKLISNMKIIPNEKNLKLNFEEFDLYKLGILINDNFSEIFDTIVVVNLNLYLAAPAGYTFINFTKDKLELEGFGDNYDFEIYNFEIVDSGSLLRIYIDISHETQECDHWVEDWDCDDDAHYGFCTSCGKNIYSEHDYDELDFYCNICGYVADFSFNLDLVLTGYSGGSFVGGVDLFFDDSLSSNMFNIVAVIFSYGKFFELQYIKSDSETFAFNRNYYLFVTILPFYDIDMIIDFIDISKFNIKGLDAELYNYSLDDYGCLNLCFELPSLVDKNNQVTKITEIKATLENAKVGKTVSDVTVTFDGINQDILGGFMLFEPDGNNLQPSHIFENKKTYVLMISFNNNHKYDTSGLEAKDITIKNTTGFLYEQYNPILDSPMYYYYITFYEANHVHSFSEEYFEFTTTLHYNKCSCGYIKTEEHIYKDNLFECTKCFSELPFIYIDNISLSLENWEYGSTLSDLKIKVNTFGIYDRLSLIEGYVGISTSSNLLNYYRGNYDDYLIDYKNHIFLDSRKYYLIVRLVSAVDMGFFMELCDYTTKNIYLEGVGNPISISCYPFSSDSKNVILAIFELPMLEVSHIHGGKWIKEVPATCENNGTKGHYECSVCEKYFDNNDVEIKDLNIEKINHSNKVHHEKVNATCGKEGNIEYWSCPSCNKLFSDEACTKEVVDVIVKKLGHTYGTVTYSLIENNTKIKAERTCVNDASHIETETMEVTKVVTQNVSCTNAEISTLSATFKNTAFGTKSYDNVVTKEKINHSNKVHHEKVNATCGNDGVIEYWSCPSCNKLFSDEACTIEVVDLTIKKLEHNYQYHYDSSTHYQECENCHDKIDMHPHSWNEGVVTKDPNIREDGIKTYTCKDCSATRTESIPKLRGCVSLSHAFITLTSLLGLLLIMRKKQSM